jgi:hypothetical protein
MGFVSFEKRMEVKAESFWRVLSAERQGRARGA